MILRSYQENGLRAILEYAAAHPCGRVLLVMAPRSGKTLTASMAVKLMTLDQGLRALWVAPSGETLDGAVLHLIACGIPADQIGIIYRDRPTNPAAPFQVATEATIDRRTKPEADFVVWDEAHHDAAARRRRIRALYPNAFHLGITGTPERLTGMGLDQDYDHMVVPVQPSELIHDGHLAVPTVFAPEDRYLPTMSGVRVRSGDYAADDLERLVGHEAAIDKLVEEWVRLGGDLPSAVFPVTVRHSKAIVARFEAAGIRAVHLDADTPTEQRMGLGEALQSGRVRVVSSVGVINEGISWPWLKCGVLARPTRSRALFIQQCSRCMTPHDGIRPRLLDMVGNHYYFRGYAWDDRAWSLSRRMRSGEGHAGGVKRCPKCSALIPCSAPACACGHTFASADVPVLSLSKALVELKMTPDQIAKKKAELEAFAANRGFKPEWVERVLAAMRGEQEVAQEIAA